MRGKFPFLVALGAGAVSGVYIFKPLLEEERRSRQLTQSGQSPTSFPPPRRNPTDPTDPIITSVTPRAPITSPGPTPDRDTEAGRQRAKEEQVMGLKDLEMGRPPRLAMERERERMARIINGGAGGGAAGDMRPRMFDVIPLVRGVATAVEEGTEKEGREGVGKVVDLEFMKRTPVTGIVEEVVERVEQELERRGGEVVAERVAGAVPAPNGVKEGVVIVEEEALKGR